MLILIIYILIKKKKNNWIIFNINVFKTMIEKMYEHDFNYENVIILIIGCLVQPYKIPISKKIYPDFWMATISKI